MKTITLTEEEEIVLNNLLTMGLSELRMEIAHTDSSDFKAGLRQRKEVLGTLQAKLAPQAETDG